MTPSLHPAQPHQVPELARLLAQAVPAAYAVASAVAQPGYAAYLEDHLRQGRIFVLYAEHEGRAVAAAEFRRVDGGLFLNAIWVEPGFRGMGLGRALIHRAVHEDAPTHVWLDVDEANVRTQQVYVNLGFKAVYRTSISRWPGQGARPTANLSRVTFPPEERRAMGRYGFCTLRVNGEPLGVMGSQVLRTTSRLSDETLACARVLFPRRTLWGLGPELGEPVATLVRMQKTL